MYFLQTLHTSLSISGALWNHREEPWNNSGINIPLSDHASPTSTSPARQIVEIAVGAAGQLAFNPGSVSVMQGTVLRFNFLGLNHTLTQSSFGHPCSNGSQFDTGFQQFNPSNSTGKFLVDFEVISNKSQWFFCAQDRPESHCRAGMVFSLNPEDKQTEYIERARNSTQHPIITPPPSLSYCPVIATSSPNSTERHSHGTSSLSVQQPKATSIVPQISNSGSRLEYWIGFCFGGLLMVFGI